MNGFLIDTNVLSEYNRIGGPDPGVKSWLESTDRELQFVSVITFAEIQKGIGLLAEGKRRTELDRWLNQDLEAWFQGRVLPVDRLVARHWSELVVANTRSGRPIPTLDSLSAATALAHNLVIITRNIKDFEGTPISTHNPWSAL